MPESTCLHIQERESGPIRVVEIPWISVRIGRAPHCEVRLPEHDLAEEVCRLQRRGPSWHLVPATTRSPILLDGQPVDGPCRLAFDVPFRFGHYCLTLRRDRAAEPDWGIYSGPVSRPLDRALPRLEAKHSAKDLPDRREPRNGPKPAIEPAREPAVEPGAMPRTTALLPGPNPELARTAGVRERWETRWRVAGAELKARSERSRRIPESAKHSYQAGIDSIPLTEPRVPRAQPPVAASIEPALDPIERKIERVPCALVPDQDDVRTATILPPTPAPAVQADEGLRDPAPNAQDATLEDAPARAISAIEPAPETLPRASPPPSATGAVEPAPNRAISDERGESPSVEIEASARQRGDDRAETKRSEGVSLRTQQGGAALPFASDGPVSDPAVNRAEWPSARDILATHRATSQPRATVATGRVTTTKRDRSQALPTLAREPGHWNMPVWLAGPPAAVLVLAAGLAGCVLSWWWACDSYSASIMTERLLVTDLSAGRRPLPESVAPPDGTWTRSTAQHLAHWAIFLGRFQGDGDRSPREIATLLERALEVSPINPTARLAMAQLEPSGGGTTVSIRSVGMSRDVLSLAWSARRLLAAGEKEAALKLYGQSLSVAMSGESSRAAVARFSEDPTAPRYVLPGEERVRDIVRELASRKEWTFAEWSAVLPDSAVVRLVAARLLREQGPSEAETLLDLVLNERRTPKAEATARALTLAARAEAFALRSRWREAGEQYRQAIELIDDDTIKRSWWFNLADIAGRLDDDNQRQAALRAAMAVASDDITRRATEIQRTTRARPTPRSTGVKAN